MSWSKPLTVVRDFRIPIGRYHPHEKWHSRSFFTFAYISINLKSPRHKFNIFLSWPFFWRHLSNLALSLRIETVFWLKYFSTVWNNSYCHIAHHLYHVICIFFPAMILKFRRQWMMDAIYTSILVFFPNKNIFFFEMHSSIGNIKI